MFGLWVTKNHRVLERREFIHIMNCEEWLGLHQDRLIPPRTHHAGEEEQGVARGLQHWGSTDRGTGLAAKCSPIGGA